MINPTHDGMQNGEEVVRGRITIRKRADDYFVYLDGNSNIWQCGKNIPEAIGMLVICHMQEELNLPNQKETFETYVNNIKIERREEGKAIREHLTGGPSDMQMRTGLALLASKIEGAVTLAKKLGIVDENTKYTDYL